MRRMAVLVSIVTFLPQLALAACVADGYTVVYVNGIFSTEESSGQQTTRLRNEIKSYSQLSSVKVIGGYNESHLAGAGDLVQSVSQAFNSPVSDYDLKTILMQIEPQVTTRKILLVGHSQGTFYTNELYKYLIANGVPTESIGVYNLATPASYVAGGGNYVTSSNDKLINFVRDLQKTGNAALQFQAVAPSLPANITVPPEVGHDSTKFAGHKLSVYLDGAAPRIVSDIDAALNRLKASNSSNSASGCFVPPTADLGYYTKAGVYVVADSLTSGAVALTNSVTSGANEFTGYVAQGLKNIGHFAQYLFSTPAAVASNTQAGAAALAMPTITEANTIATPPKPSAPVVSNASNSDQQSTPPAIVDTPEPLPAEIAAPVAVPDAPSPAPPSNAFASLMPVQPGFGGGGGGGGGASPSEQESNADPAPASASVPLVVSLPANDSVLATTSISASGTASANALLTVTIDAVVATTSADGDGNWAIALTLAEGASTVTFVAADDSGNESAAITRTVTVDTYTPVAPVLAIAECAYSLVVASCVIPNDSVSLSWDAVPDAVSYEIEQDGQVVATTDVLTHAASIALDATTTFAIIVYDAAGNQARSTPLDVTAISRSIIINEVAWAGTEFVENQWIEIKNLSSYALDLSHVSISRTDGAPIVLTGSIGAPGPTPNTPGAYPPAYAIVEPHNFNSFDLNEIITPFEPLATDHAEQLALVWNGITLDATPETTACASWCAGGLDVPLGRNAAGRPDFRTSLSMERTSDSSDGRLASSWKSTDSYGATLGIPGATRWGTAGYPNSEGLPDSGVYCGSSSNLVVANQGFDFAGTCTFLTKFITIQTLAVGRMVGLYRGVQGNATLVRYFLPGTGSSYTTITPLAPPSDAVAGEPFFFAMMEIRRAFEFTDPGQFGQFLIDGSASAPHDNYVIIPFTYQPQ